MKKMSGIMLVLPLMVLFTACQKKNGDLSRLDQLGLENEKLRKENTELKHHFEILTHEDSEFKELRNQVEKLTINVAELNAKLINRETKLKNLPHQVREKLHVFLEDKRSGIWDCGRNTGCIELKREIKSASVMQIIKALNMDLVLKSIKDNTVFIKQENAYMLNRMGSAGLHCNHARVVFSFTSVKGIEYVDFEYDEGSPLEPSRYSRIDFLDLWPLFPPQEDTN